MFEGILLIIFAIIGGMTTLPVVFFIIVGILRHSKTMIRIGCLVALIPLTLFCLVYWFYDIHIPNHYKKQKLDYIGTYTLISSDDTKSENEAESLPKLTLYPNDTFEISKSSYLFYFGKGTWKVGATDEGQFEFKDSLNTTIFRAMPSNNNKLEIDKFLNKDKEIVFIKK